jgi:hypothetical protein
VAVIPMTPEEVTRLCANVTPRIREYCAVNMFAGAEFPEFFLSGCTGSDDGVGPFSEEQWWEIILERIPRASVSLSTSDAAQ